MCDVDLLYFALFPYSVFFISCSLYPVLFISWVLQRVPQHLILGLIHPFLLSWFISLPYHILEKLCLSSSALPVKEKKESRIQNKSKNLKWPNNLIQSSPTRQQQYIGLWTHHRKSSYGSYTFILLQILFSNITFIPSSPIDSCGASIPIEFS